MADPAPITKVKRKQIPLTIDADVWGWVAAHSLPGGHYANATHAADRAIHRILAEMDLVRAECRKRRETFDALRFLEIYREDIDASRPEATGPVPKGGRPRRSRLQYYASPAMGLVERILEFSAPEGPFVSLSQAVEVGLRQERRSDDGRQPQPSDPQALWARYGRLPA